jgi:hypothetical protein
MNSESSPGEATAQATHSAEALSEAICQARKDAQSVADVANRIVARWKQHAPDQDDGIIDEIQASLRRFQSIAVHVNALLDDREEQQREADRQRASDFQRLQRRLTDTQAALRHSSAASVALQTVHRLLRQQARQVTDFTRVGMLDDAQYQAQYDAAWFDFMASQRLSPAAAVERALRDVNDEPLPSFARPTVSRSADLSGTGGDRRNTAAARRQR